MDAKVWQEQMERQCKQIVVDYELFVKHTEVQITIDEYAIYLLVWM
jgi:hypothetical protein